MTRLIQLQRGPVRRVALVEEPNVRLLDAFADVYTLAWEAIAAGTALSALACRQATGETLPYDPIYNGLSEWRLLVPFDHPREPARCLVSGTGLTHFGSAQNRHAMHQATGGAELTDSLRMFRSGLEKGRPAPGQVGIAPEWFFKGTGGILRAHGEPLLVPAYAEDGGEEAEVAGLYLIGPEGRPHCVGMAAGNEFADHRFEKRNYLNLAGSKIRTCSVGPELVIAPDFQSVPGHVELTRGTRVIWAKDIRTGEAEMTHSRENLEHHHFKFVTHRRPGDVHVHFFGAHSISFGDQVEIMDGDVARINFAGFGRPLSNPILREPGADVLVRVQNLT